MNPFRGPESALFSDSNHHETLYKWWPNKNLVALDTFLSTVSRALSGITAQGCARFWRPSKSGRVDFSHGRIPIVASVPSSAQAALVTRTVDALALVVVEEV